MPSLSSFRAAVSGFLLYLLYSLKMLFIFLIMLWSRVHEMRIFHMGNTAMMSKIDKAGFSKMKFAQDIGLDGDYSQR